MLNQVVLVGRLTDNPTVIETENGKKYTAINLAVQRAFKNSDGIYESDFMGKASFCNVQDLKGRIQAYVARDEIGEESYADFKKYDVGDILGIKGRLQNRSYETDDNETKYITEVIAERVTFLSSNKNKDKSSLH